MVNCICWAVAAFAACGNGILKLLWQEDSPQPYSFDFDAGSIKLLLELLFDICLNLSRFVCVDVFSSVFLDFSSQEAMKEGVNFVST